MTTRTIAEQADYLSRRRSRMLPVLVVVYMSQQTSFFATMSQPDHPGGASAVKIGAWVVLSLVLLLALATKGFWFQPREVRDLIDDELTQVHRLKALRAGFLMSMGVAIVCYFLDQVDPLTARQAIHLIVSFGLGVALLVFAVLEKRAHRDG